MKRLTKFRFEPRTSTIRSVPENYWIATVKDGKLVFDSWDAAIKGRINQETIKIKWRLGLIREEKRLVRYGV